MRRGWLVWADWCFATGRTSLHVTEEALAAFERDVAGDHVADIRRTVIDAGLGWPREVQPTDPWRTVEEYLAPLDVSLRRCPSAGWPGGYRGRRDAWLLVATRQVRLPRRRALEMTSEHVVSTRGRIEVAGVEVPRQEDPSACPACVVARWMTVVAEEDHWGRSGVREMLVLAKSEAGHVCGQPLPEIPDHVALAPAIDQHGWAVSWRPMSARALTQVLADRCAPGSWKSPPVADVADEDQGGRGRGFDETTFQRLDVACEEADEVNARIEALLGETEEMVKQTGAARTVRWRT